MSIRSAGVLVIIMLCCKCIGQKNANRIDFQHLQQKIQELENLRTASEVADDSEKFISYYTSDAICMPEYQTMLAGTTEIKAYYNEIFQRQKIKSFNRKTEEIIQLNQTIIEIGTFTKKYSNHSDTLRIQQGKYWTIWKTDSGNNLKITGESFGFTHSIKNPSELVYLNQAQPDESEVLLKKQIPLELKAYNALMEKGVRTRNGDLRSSFFAEDAVIMPFAEPTVKGIDRIKPYLNGYSNRGTITLQAVMCYTYDFEYADNYVLEYDMFKVKWSRENQEGRTEGKGIRIWKRQPDHSLKLYREIGTHNYLEN